MKNNIIYLSLILLFASTLSSCFKEKIDDQLDINSIEHFYEVLGKVEVTVDGQKNDRPLVGIPLFHPSLFDNPDTKSLWFFTWNIEDWIQFYQDGKIANNEKFETLQLKIDVDYEGVGRYELKNSDNQICYSLSFYDSQNETAGEESRFCSDLISDENSKGYIEVTSDKNGRVKGKFSTKAKSSETGEVVEIEGSFDIKYGD